MGIEIISTGQCLSISMGTTHQNSFFSHCGFFSNCDFIPQDQPYTPGIELYGVIFHEYRNSIFWYHTEFSPSISDFFCFHTCLRRCRFLWREMPYDFSLYYNFVSFLIRQGPVSSRGFKVQLEMIELMRLILPAWCLNNSPRNWLKLLDNPEASQSAVC